MKLEDETIDTSIGIIGNKRLSAVLQAALGVEHYLPKHDPAPLAEVLASGESLASVIDGTERPTQRPSDDTLQRRAFSGKKTPTHKNILVIDVAQEGVR